MIGCLVLAFDREQRHMPLHHHLSTSDWIPACAGMTEGSHL